MIVMSCDVMSIRGIIISDVNMCPSRHKLLNIYPLVTDYQSAVSVDKSGVENKRWQPIRGKYTFGIFSDYLPSGDQLES